MLELAPIAVLALLAAASIMDLLERRIPNLLPAGIALLWLAQVTLVERDLSQWPAAVAALGIFPGAFVLWRVGWLGGGDVKLVGALALWVGPGKLVPLLLLSGLLGGALAMLWLHLLKVSAFLPSALSAIVRGPASGAGMKPTLPYGLAIALAGAWLIHERFWL